MNDNNTLAKKSALSAGFVIAMAWFATHCGAGFATGNQEVNYFVKFGWVAIFLPIIAMILLAWGHRNAIIIAKDHNAHDYKSFTNALFHPYEKIMGPIMEILFLGFLGTGVCTSIAGAASLLQTWGVAYGLGLVIVGVVLLALTAFGSSLVVKVLNFKAYFIITALAIVTILGIKSGLPNISHIVSTKANFGAGFGEALWKTIVYAGFQSVTIFALVSISHSIKTTKQANTFFWTGCLINGAMLLAVVIMLLGYAPQVLTETLPVLYVTTGLGIPWLQILYSLILFIALLGTGVAVVFAAVARFEKLEIWERSADVFKDMRMRRGVISFITITICACISVVGLTNIVVKGYGTLGYLAIPLLLLPEIVIGGMKIRKAAELRKQQGIDEDALDA